MTTETLWLIPHPTAHRRAERLMSGIDEPHVMTLAPERDDDWLCDVCSQRLDPHATIHAVGLSAPSYAVCRDCLNGLPPLPSKACPCPGCSPREP